MKGHKATKAMYYSTDRSMMVDAFTIASAHDDLQVLLKKDGKCSTYLYVGMPYDSPEGTEVNYIDACQQIEAKYPAIGQFENTDAAAQKIFQVTRTI